MYVSGHQKRPSLFKIIIDRSNFRKLIMLTNRKFKLLIIDDDKLFHEIYENLFAHDFDVVILSCGKDALCLLEENIYDAVITDINMPEIDGIELSRKIRESNTINKNIIIIGVTATPHSFDKEACIAGVSKLFAKPMEFLEIQPYLNKVLQR